MFVPEVMNNYYFLKDIVDMMQCLRIQKITSVTIGTVACKYGGYLKFKAINFKIHLVNPTFNFTRFSLNFSKIVITILKNTFLSRK